MNPLATTRSRLGAAGKGSKPDAGTGFAREMPVWL